VKLAFVVQRYGAEIAGGSEAHCRQLAQRLAARHEITVLTSCAIDYVSWANALPPGHSLDGQVRVLRFPVSRPRRRSTFGDISDRVFDGGATAALQEAWFRENGPDTPALIEYLRSHGSDFDLVLFWTFRYAPSYFGLPVVASKAILAPTAEDDQAIDIGVLSEFFAKPAGYLFLTPEEQALVASRMDVPLPPSAIVGMGIDEQRANGGLASHDLDRLDLPSRFVLYLGRVDRNKGCETLLDYFQRYTASKRDVTLILAGPTTLQIPAHPLIRSLGYVSNEVRRELLARADLLVVPSPYESLSIVLLEAWNAGVPALVNGRCRVLQGQVRRADGGLSYTSFREFESALEYLLAHDAERQTLGRQGRAYVDSEYRWPRVIDRVEALLRDVSGSRRESPHR
jgi:glycosyltransferase involved in cell wall biosynthesis